MRILKIILLLPVLAYGAAWAYLWYEVKTGADDVVKMASPFAKISYGSVHVSLLGDEIGLDNVLITPAINQDEFRIEKLRLNAPNMLYFISANKNLEKGDFPEKFGMQISRLHLNINSESFSMLEQMSKQGETTEAGGMQILFDLDAFGCGDIKTFTLNDYRKMGMGDIVIDVDANSEYDQERNTALVSVKAGAEGLNRIEFRAELKNGLNMGSAVAGSDIPKMTLSMHDTGYYKLRNAYCADLNDSDGEAYVDRHIQVLSEKLNAKFQDEVVAAYKRFMLAGGGVDIRINPSPAAKPGGLQFYAFEDIVKMLGLDIAINGKTIKFNEVKWTGSRPQATVSGRAESKKSPPQTAQRPTVKRTAKLAPSNSALVYKEIRTADAGKHIDSMVEVSTLDGKVRRGLLEKVSDNRIYLVIKLSAGTLSYPVELQAISKLRVSN